MSEDQIRTAFEAWYCEDAQKQGVEVDSITHLRLGNGYGPERHMLNGKWWGWQAAWHHFNATRRNLEVSE